MWTMVSIPDLSDYFVVLASQQVKTADVITIDEEQLSDKANLSHNTTTINSMGTGQ